MLAVFGKIRRVEGFLGVGGEVLSWNTVNREMAEKLSGGGGGKSGGASHKSVIYTRQRRTDRSR